MPELRPGRPKPAIEDGRHVGRYEAYSRLIDRNLLGDLVAKDAMRKRGGAAFATTGLNRITLMSAR